MRGISLSKIGKISTIIIFVGGLIVGGIKWSFNTAVANAKLEAQIEFMNKYEKTITENITLRANCGDATKLSTK